MITDEEIRDRICRRLSYDQRFGLSKVNVTVVQREVTLTGAVSSPVARRQVETSASQVPGVLRVNNLLTTQFPKNLKIPSDETCRHWW